MILRQWAWFTLLNPTMEFSMVDTPFILVVKENRNVVTKKPENSAEKPEKIEVVVCKIIIFSLQRVFEIKNQLQS